MSAKAKTNPRESTVVRFYKFDIETGVAATCVAMEKQNFLLPNKYLIIDMKSTYYIYSVKF
jgi:hypothetical protein